MKDELEAIRAQLARIESGPGVAKASLREVALCESHAAFVAAVDYLLALPGWSLSRVANHMCVHKTTLSDWCRYGDETRKQIPGWAFRALPRECHSVFLKAMLGWNEIDSIARAG